jgi:hypothetical protein
MKTESEMLELLRRLYSEAGGEPSELVKVTPLYGGWYNALKFEVIRSDNARACVWRKDIDASDFEAITDSLKAFSGPR